MAKRLRGFKDRDYLKTRENFFFCVVGYLHPRGRVISYLKYVPSSDGKWGKDLDRYARSMPFYTIPHLLDNIDVLGEKYPHYVFHSDVFNIDMSAVPLNSIVKHYCPEKKLCELRGMDKLDPLQKMVFELASLLSEKSGVAIDNFGVTGSILIDIHRPEFSDIDLTVYGYENSLKVKQSLLSLFSGGDSPIQRLSKPILERWCEEKSRSYPITFEEAKKCYERKWNYGLFKERIFSIHPIKMNEEINENYGDKLFIPKEIVIINGKVSEVRESIFLPCIYGVEKVKVVVGEQVEDISEVTSYEGFYGGLLNLGEAFVARGKLEGVFDKKLNKTYHRVLVGSPEAMGRDYIKPATF